MTTLLERTQPIPNPLPAIAFTGIIHVLTIDDHAMAAIHILTPEDWAAHKTRIFIMEKSGDTIKVNDIIAAHPHKETLLTDGTLVHGVMRRMPLGTPPGDVIASKAIYPQLEEINLHP